MTIRSTKSSLLGLTAAAALLAVPALAQTQAQPRDGAPGNPPSTATQRAADSVTGNRTPADGTPGNPPGTALGRAVDRAGDNAADANRRAGDPLNTQNRPDGTPGNPPGTALGRAVDRATDGAATTNNRAGDPLNTQNRPDGTPGNPPGTALGRAADRATDGTADANRRAGDPANAENRTDGTPGNPPGTVVTRGVDRALGTNLSGAFPENERTNADTSAGGGSGGNQASTTGRSAPGAGDRRNEPGATNANPGAMGTTQGPNARPMSGQAMDRNAIQGGSAQGNPQPGEVNRTPQGDQARAGTMTVPLQNQAAGTAPTNPPAGASATSPANSPAATPRSATAANPAATAPMAQTDRVSRIIGSNVYNERNESIGSVDDVILASGGSSPMAIVSVGGFLGIGAKLVAVPMSELRWSAADNRWTITGATRESLTSLPAYSYDAARRG
ncbi:PRC-barrel domain-containing protein [Roseomonas sp. WA12]